MASALGKRRHHHQLAVAAGGAAGGTAGADAGGAEDTMVLADGPGLGVALGEGLRPDRSARCAARSRAAASRAAVSRSARSAAVVAAGPGSAVWRTSNVVPVAKPTTTTIAARMLSASALGSRRRPVVPVAVEAGRSRNACRALWGLLDIRGTLRRRFEQERAILPGRAETGLRGELRVIDGPYDA